MLTENVFELVPFYTMSVIMSMPHMNVLKVAGFQHVLAPTLWVSLKLRCLETI